MSVRNEHKVGFLIDVYKNWHSYQKTCTKSLLDFLTPSFRISLYQNLKTSKWKCLKFSSVFQQLKALIYELCQRRAEPNTARLGPGTSKWKFNSYVQLNPVFYCRSYHFSCSQFPINITFVSKLLTLRTAF